VAPPVTPGGIDGGPHGSSAPGGSGDPKSTRQPPPADPGSRRHPGHPGHVQRACADVPGQAEISGRASDGSTARFIPTLS
jgi:hypothetical protein